MTSFAKYLCSAGVVALLGSAASADVSAQEVWDSWTEQMAIYGDGFTTGAQVMEGNTLVVPDVRIQMSDETGAILAEIGDVRLLENGDGTVTITLPAQYPITLKDTPNYGDPSTVRLSVLNEGLSMTVSGDAAAMVYDIAATRQVISVDSLEGDLAEEVELREAIISISDVAGQYTIAEGDLRKITHDLTVGSISVDVEAVEPGGDGSISGTGQIADIAFQADFALPKELDLEAELPPFIDGMALAGGFSFGSLAYEFSGIGIDAGEASVQAQVSADGGQFDFAFNYDEFIYTTATQALQVSLFAPQEFPVPINVALASIGIDLRTPLSRGEGGPRDVRLAFDLTDLVVSDDIWNMGDPQQMLPRGPITLAFDADAQITMFFDLFDPEQSEAFMMADVPGELNSITLNTVTVQAVGAEVKGDGAFTFDNSDRETFDGLPRPQGSANFALNGINGLVDTLIEMGLIPAEEAMMPRMMMGMFATPVGDDMLTSTVEVNNQGHLLVNGQRLQ